MAANALAASLQTGPGRLLGHTSPPEDKTEAITLASQRLSDRRTDSEMMEENTLACGGYQQATASWAVAILNRGCSILCVSTKPHKCNNLLSVKRHVEQMRHRIAVDDGVTTAKPPAVEEIQAVIQVWFQGRSVKIIPFVSGEQQHGSSPRSLWLVVLFSDAQCLHISLCRRGSAICPEKAIWQPKVCAMDSIWRVAGLQVLSFLKKKKKIESCASTQSNTLLLN